METPVRQLVAIMFTDIVGYTSLMNQDEDHAYQILRLNRSLHEEFVKRYNGKLLKEMGDGMLVSFPSTTDAISCALHLQEASTQHKDLSLRIGIHLGEVMVEDDDIIGDGVNVASRIEALAKAGEVYISESVSRTLKSNKGYQSQFIAEKKLKNVDDPVKIYRITKAGQGSEDDFQMSSSASKNRLTFRIAFVIFLVLAISAILYLQNKSSSISSGVIGSVEKSIAVLPFRNVSSDEVNQYFTDGVMGEIHNHLSKIADLKVTSITSVEKFRNSSTTVPAIGRELGVTHLVEGSVQKFGQNYRITINLIDAKADERIWSDQYSMQLAIDELLQAQTDIASMVINKMQANLSDREIEQINYKPTSDLTAYEYYLLGNFHSRKIENRIREKRASIKHYKNAIGQDPDFADAYAKMGESYSILAYFLPEDSPAYIDSANVAVEKALTLNPMQADALNAKAYLKRTFEWDWEEARNLYLRARSIDPNNSLVLRNYSLLLACINDLDSALRVAEKAVELDPLNDQMTENVGRMYFFSRRYSEIIDIYAKEGIAESGQGAMHLAEAYLYNGDTAKAMELALANIPAFVDSLQESRLDSLYQVGDYPRLTEEFVVMMSGGGEEVAITFDWLQNAYEKRDGYLVYILVDPVFDRFKDDPRYDSIVVKMGLDKYL